MKLVQLVIRLDFIVITFVIALEVRYLSFVKARDVVLIKYGVIGVFITDVRMAGFIMVDGLFTIWSFLHSSSHSSSVVVVISGFD